MKVVGSTLYLPHSNVNCVWLKLLKNSLKPCSLVSLLHMKNALGRAGISAHHLTMDRDLKIPLLAVDSDATEKECQQILAELYKM